MKLVPLVLVFALAVSAIRAQGGTDTKAQLQKVLTSAQQAFDQKKLEQAEEILNEARAIVHDDFKAIMLRARVNHDLGEFGKAETFAARATELDPNNIDAKLLRGSALFQQAEAAKSGALNSGSRVAGFYESALTEFEKAAKIKPDHPDLPAWRAACLFWLDRVPEALQVWEGLRKMKPDDPEPLLRIAEIHRKMENEDAALKAASDGLVTKGPSTIRGDLATIIFGIQSKRGKVGEAFTAFKAWSAAHPDDAQAWLWLGYIRFMEKNFDEAVTNYQKGFDVSGKKNAGLALELGNALAQKGDLPKAAEWYGTALKLQSAWPNYDASPFGQLNAIAYTFVSKNDFAKGVEILEKNALPAALKDRKTMNNLGLYYRDWAGRGKGNKSRNEKSLEYYLKASKLVLEDETATPVEKAQVLNDTGVVYDYQLGNVEKGVEYYRQALQNDPTFGDALENLGLCFNKLGKYEEAIPLFQKLLDQQPGRRVAQNGLAEAKKAVEKDKPASR